MSGGVWTPKPDTPLQDSLYKRNLYLINYNRMRTQWTTKGNRDSSYSCSCDRGLHRYLRNFGGGGVEPPKPPPRYATAAQRTCWLWCPFLTHIFDTGTGTPIVHCRLALRFRNLSFLQLSSGRGTFIWKIVFETNGILETSLNHLYNKFKSANAHNAELRVHQIL